MTASWFARAATLSLMVGCTTAQSSADAVRYEIDGAHTHIVWQVDRFGFTNTVGTFTDISGSLILDEADPESSQVTAEIALAGLRSDLQEREDIVRGAHWLNAQANPTISFRSTAVRLVVSEACPSQCAEVIGEMQLNGQTATLTLQVQLNKLGTDPVTRRQAAGFSATGAFDRSAFGVNTAIGPIGDTVRFQIEALAVAAED